MSCILAIGRALCCLVVIFCADVVCCASHVRWFGVAFLFVDVAHMATFSTSPPPLRGATARVTGLLCRPRKRRRVVDSDDDDDDPAAGNAPEAAAADTTATAADAGSDSEMDMELFGGKVDDMSSAEDA